MKTDKFLGKDIKFLTGQPTSAFVQMSNAVSNINIEDVLSNAASRNAKLAEAMNIYAETTEAVSALQSLTTGVTAGVIGTANNAMNTVSSVYNKVVSGDLILSAQNIVQTSVERAATDVANRMLSITNFATSLASSIPNRIQSYATAYFDEYKTTLEKELQKLTSDPQEILEKQQEESNKKAEEESKQSISDQINEVKGKCNEVFASINSYIAEASKYIEEGPMMVQNTIDQLTKDGMEAIDGKLKEAKQYCSDQADAFCKSQGDNLGVQMVMIYNKTIEDLAKKQLNLKEKLKTKAQTLAFSAKQKGILKIMSMTGINISV